MTTAPDTRPAHLPLAERSRAMLEGWRGTLLLTGVTALCAQISFHIPPTPVPVTFQVFAVLLSGLLLGARRGMIAQLQYLALGLLGAPVFALGKSGLPALLGITGGYLWAYPVAAFLAGMLNAKFRDLACCGRWMGAILGCAAGMAVIYALGCGWLAAASGLASKPLQVVIAGMGWFLLCDAAKAGCAIAVAKTLKRDA